MKFRASSLIVLAVALLSLGAHAEEELPLTPDQDETAEETSEETATAETAAPESAPVETLTFSDFSKYKTEGTVPTIVVPFKTGSPATVLRLENRLRERKQDNLRVDIFCDKPITIRQAKLPELTGTEIAEVILYRPGRKPARDTELLFPATPVNCHLNLQNRGDKTGNYRLKIAASGS